MLTFDETTLERAAAVYGPFRLEHRFLQQYARLNRAAAYLSVLLVDMLEKQPVDRREVMDTLTQTSVATAEFYLAQEQLEALFDRHPDGKASPFFSLHTAMMNQLERSVRKAEQARANRYGAPAAAPKPDTYEYDKREVLDMVCTMAAREAAEKEESHGTV